MAKRRWTDRLYDSLRESHISSRLEDYAELAPYPKPLACLWLLSAERDFKRRHPYAPRILSLIGVAAVLGFAVVTMIPETRKTAWPAGVVAALFLSLAVLGYVQGPRFQRIIRDRLREELRCGRFLNCLTCDYDLRGATSDRCPECGEPVRIADWEERFRK